MEGWVVGPVNRVFSVDIAHDEKRVVLRLFQDGYLVGGSVRSQTKIPIEVVSISGSTANVILGNEECIKAVFRCHNWIKVAEQLELFSWHSYLRKPMCSTSIEKGVRFADESGQGVLWFFVELSLCQIEYPLRNIGEVIFSGA